MKGDPPQYCPFCSAPLEVVRHLPLSHMFEVACGRNDCDRTAVILIDDEQELQP